MSFIDDIVKVGSLGLVDDFTGAGEAADQQREAVRQQTEATLASTEKNIDFSKWLWGEQKDISEPWREAGEKAIGGYEDAISKPFTAEDMELDPGYDFRLSEGLKGYERSAAAKGMQLSGRTLKGLGRYAQDYASNEFGQAYARRQQGISNLYNLANMGQAAAAGQAQSGGQMGAQVSNSILQGGQAQAQMYSDFGDINAAEAQSGFNSLMQIGGLAAQAYGAS